MNIDDLWIGDRLRVKSINEDGTFEGTTDKGLIIVQLNIGTVEVIQQDVELLPDKVDPPIIPIDSDPEPVLSEKKEFKNEIDLHYQSLSKQNLNINYGNILSYQISACRAFIKEAIAKKTSYITIIHGKGEGVLKSEIKQLLLEFKVHIFAQQEINNGGAILVFFSRYNPIP